MYRLICPVVDAACENSKLVPFFEYSKPNGPNKRLSADIALLADGRTTPVWLIEAKKYGRTVVPGMIDAYLTAGVMGVVTNGNHWIIRVGGRNLKVGPLLRPDGLVNARVYENLVAMISTCDEASALALSDEWEETWRPTTTPLAPRLWKVSGGTGSRAYHLKARYQTLQEAARAAHEHTAPGAMPAALLQELAQSDIQSQVGYFEVNQARMIWWLGDGSRGARLKLSGKHLELLVHNRIIERMGAANVRASIKLHDKNPGMSMLKAAVASELEGLSELFRFRTV